MLRRTDAIRHRRDPAPTRADEERESRARPGDIARLYTPRIWL